MANGTPAGKCNNCGAPLPVAAQGLPYKCDYCSAAAVPGFAYRFGTTAQHVLDSVTGAKAAMLKPVYAPGRYAARNMLTTIGAVILAIITGMLLPPLGIVMLIVAIASMLKTIYWLVRWANKTAAQKNLSPAQIHDDRQAINTYYAKQQQAAGVALKWLAGLTISIAAFSLTYILQHSLSDVVITIIVFTSGLGFLICLAFTWLNAITWLSEPDEKESK